MWGESRVQTECHVKFVVNPSLFEAVVPCVGFASSPQALISCGSPPARLLLMNSFLVVGRRLRCVGGHPAALL